MAVQTHSDASSRGAECVSIICRNSTNLSIDIGQQEVYIRLGLQGGQPDCVTCGQTVSVTSYQHGPHLGITLGPGQPVLQPHPNLHQGLGIPAVQDGDQQQTAAARTRPQHNLTTNGACPEPYLLLCGLPSSLHTGCQLCGGLGVA